MSAADVLALAFMLWYEGDCEEFVPPEWAANGAPMASEALGRSVKRILSAGFLKRDDILEPAKGWPDAVLSRLERLPGYYTADLNGLRSDRRKHVSQRSRALKAIEDGRAR